MMQRAYCNLRADNLILLIIILPDNNASLSGMLPVIHIQLMARSSVLRRVLLYFVSMVRKYSVTYGIFREPLVSLEVRIIFYSSFRRTKQFPVVLLLKPLPTLKDGVERRMFSY
ncbi:hypothetical protein GW17_00029475 [Ensete ventricosum]|nr:hypothetical protein GW17_00029475 [Ensete ventricosum]